MRKFKAIVLLGVCVVVVVAALWLMLSNLTADWTLHFYTVDFKALRRGWVLLAAAAVGVVIYLVLRYCLPAGLKALKAARMAGQARANHDRITRLEAQNPRE